MRALIEVQAHGANADRGIGLRGGSSGKETGLKGAEAG